MAIEKAYENLTPPIPYSSLFPKPKGPDCPAWMTPLIASEGKSAPVKFATFKEGGAALLNYLRLIQGNKIPYFFDGPGTLLGSILLIYRSTCAIQVNHRWSDILALLPEEADEGP